jgi:starch-binding outer membrane protein, SusD/RagB family
MLPANSSAPSRARSLWACVALLLSACNLMQVTNTAQVSESAYDNPPGAVTRYNGAIATFTEGFSPQVFATAILTDELSDRTGTQSIDKRVINPQTSVPQYPFSNLSVARINGLRAIGALQRYNALPSERIGELWALVGYVEMMFAENLCSPTPLGFVNAGVPGYGSVMSRQQLIAVAIAHFDSARAYAHPSIATSDDSATSVQITDLALVGRARALADSGDLDGAAATVTSVPVSFIYQPSFDSSSQTNQMVLQVNLNQSTSVSDNEGINGLPFVSANDPRVPTTPIGTSSYDGLPVVALQTYASLASPITLASGVEGQLLEAEDLLHHGDQASIASWAAILNALRQTAISPSMGPLTADSTTTAGPAMRVAVMFRERAFWLFATGHRHGDMRRLIRYYGQGAESVFPTGPYANGTGTYGTATVFLPLEQNDPSFNGCTNLQP